MSRKISQDAIVLQFLVGDYFPFVQQGSNVRMDIGTLFDALKAASTVQHKFVSQPLTLAAATVITVPHQLPSMPTFFHFYVQCTVAELGYAVGDMVRLDSYSITEAGGVTGVLGSLVFTPVLSYYGGSVSVNTTSIVATIAKTAYSFYRSQAVT